MLRLRADIANQEAPELLGQALGSGPRRPGKHPVTPLVVAVLVIEIESALRLRGLEVKAEG